MHQEKYTLKWQSYTDHLKSMMKELMMNEDFSDVTLVTEDKKQIKANVHILRTCSPVFEDIFMKEKYSNQIMYLRGIQYSEMESIMQFIYLGEATFYEDRMDEFLAVAKSLQIKELSNAASKTKSEPEDVSSQSDQGTPIEKFEEPTLTPDHITDQAKQDNEQCRKFECDQCHKTYSRSGALRTHKQSAHEGVKYSCDQCSYQAAQQCNISRHIQSMHDGVKFACDQCDYEASRQDNLNLHIQSKHAGIKFSCDQCDYQGGYSFDLKRHIKKKHLTC